MKIALEVNGEARSVDCAPKPRSQVYEESPVKGSPLPVELEHLECEETVLSGEFVRTFEWTDSDPFTGDPVFDFGLRGIRSGGAIEFRAIGSRALAQSTIYHHATLFHDYPSLTVEVQGHCDDRGTTDYNLALGMRRAAAIDGALQRMGVAGSRVKTVSYGEERPAARGAGESIWSQNRRAEFRVLSADVPNVVGTLP